MKQNVAEQKLKKLLNDINRQKEPDKQIKALAEMLYTLAAYIFSTNK